MTRRRFELRIAPLLRRVDAVIDDVLRNAGLPAERVVEVVCTGGSSAVPAARALLGRRFPQARPRDMARFSGVAAGRSQLMRPVD